MSFDLALSKGSLKIGPDGDLAKVRDNTKLVQDVLKVFHTPLGSDPFFLQKGSNITSQNIGHLVNKQFLTDRTTASAIKTLQYIQAVQKEQAKTQTLTLGETIADLGEVSVSISEEDPRQFNIRLSVFAATLDEVILPPISLKTTL